MKEDQGAYKTLLGRGLIEFNPLTTPEHKQIWGRLNAELVERLTGKIFSKDLLERVRAAAKK